jgi:UDP-N-acetylglucosamine/UDP-N-acetylgalactosamine 4-epimerase
MNILVTGAVGFIGSNLVITLLNEGHSVLAFDNLSNASIKPTDRIKAHTGDNWQRFKFYKADIRNIDQMVSILSNNPVDIIIHLAAMGSVPKSFAMPSDFIDVNERGFSNMLILAGMTSLKRIVYASSSSVYGDLDKYTLRSEGNCGMPLSPYALSKVHNELLAKMLGHKYGITHIGLRFFNVYGPGQRHDSPYSAVIPKFIHGKEIHINGDGSVVRDFTQVDDVSEAIIKAMQYNVSDVFNVCTGRGTSILELANIISNGKKKINFLPARTSDVPVSIGDTVKAENLLGFKATRHVQFELQRLMNG